ncbi:HET-R [Echria macrotheca]|uniref:HET-R n=1 Tax=Echria macrotheca TaxID=438768 RepID=A0AAJ0B5Y7_9PEZI|nr:HET-R [Echria macrotheca]
MRLLEYDASGDEVRLKEYLSDDEVPPYAILSHTWGKHEVLLQHLVDGTAANDVKLAESYAKIKFCAKQVQIDGLRYFWDDTCCIDKSNAQELQAALNSMFKWYQHAAKCYVYLSDVLADDPSDKTSWESAFRASRWFTRGWTLQELIAPAIVEFFSKEGRRLGDKKTLEQEIHAITGIPMTALRGSLLSNFGVDERFAWTAKRKTQLPKDKAYSLFGIFDVHIPVLYGEGEAKAFDRLREKLTKDHSRLAKLWSADSHLEPMRDPRVDKKRIENAKGGLLSDAYRWVLENETFRSWRETRENQILWVRGDPGKGKTMLLCGIINYLEQSINNDGGNVTYFLFQATDNRINNATALLRGLIYLLASRQPRLLSHFPENTYPSDDAMAWPVLSKLLQEMLRDANVKTTCLVVDALDECVTGLEQFLDLVEQTSLLPSRVKWVLSSRNWPDIERRLSAMEKYSGLSLELNAESVAAAVSVYVQHKVRHLSRIKHYDSETEATVHRHLLNNATGTFLWVALVCQNLEKLNVAPWNVRKVLERFPAGLDSLYGQMMSRIDQLEDAELCKHLLAVTTLTYRPLTSQELASLADVPSFISSNPQFLQDFIQSCGSFLTLQNQVVYFVHQSAKDYLLATTANDASRRTVRSIFPSGAGNVHKAICLQYLDLMSKVLARDIYSLGAPGFPIHQVSTPDPDPLEPAKYSCIYWIGHFCEAASSSESTSSDLLKDNGAVHIFLRSKYLHWLEALSLLQAVSEGVRSMRQLQKSMRNAMDWSHASNSRDSQSTEHAESRHLAAFVWDAYRFIASFGQIIEQAPLQTYASALLFAPENSLVKRNFSSEFPKFVSAIPFPEKESFPEKEWNACLQSLAGHQGEVIRVAFSPDGKKLASVSQDGTVKLWSSGSGKCLLTLQGYFPEAGFSEVRCGSLAFSAPDLLATAVEAYPEPMVRIWNTTTGKCICTIRGCDPEVLEVVFLSNTLAVLSGGPWRDGDFSVKIFDPTSGRYIRTQFSGAPGIRSMASSPGGLLAVGCRDGSIRTWHATLGQRVWTLPDHVEQVTSLAFTTDGDLLASAANYTGSIGIWSTSSGKCIRRLGAGPVSSLAFSPAGLLASGSASYHTIKIWSVSSEEPLMTISASSDERIYIGGNVPVSFSADGLLASGWECEIKIWDIAFPLNSPRQQELSNHGGPLFPIVLSSDGLSLASGHGRGRVRIWDTRSGQGLKVLEVDYNQLVSLAFSPNNQIFASASTRSVKVWDTKSWQCLWAAYGDWNTSPLVFSPDSMELAGAVALREGNGDIGIWSVSSGRCLHLETMIEAEYTCTQEYRMAFSRAASSRAAFSRAAFSRAAFSPDNTRLATGSCHEDIGLWEKSSWRCIWSLPATETDRTYIDSIVFSPDSEQLAAAFGDNTIRIWETASGSCVKRVECQNWRIRRSLSTATPSWLFGDINTQAYGVSEDNEWVTYGRENVLWLPPAYRPFYISVQGMTMAFWYQNEKSFVLHFNKPI